MSRQHHHDDLSAASMLELFRLEAETQAAVLTNGLLEVERAPAPALALELLMRAAHSIKGAARIVNLNGAVRVAHAMEDCFVAAQQGLTRLGRAEIDVLLRGVDLISNLARRPESKLGKWEDEHAKQIQEFLDAIAQLRGAAAAAGNPPAHPAKVTPTRRESGRPEVPQAVAARRHEPSERVVRLAAENLNRLLALAGESLVDSRWLRPFAESLERLKRQQVDIGEQVERMRQRLEQENVSAPTREHINEIARSIAGSRRFLAERLEELDVFDRRAAQLSQRLYLEVLRTRMRPFADGVRRFPRMVRDLARSLDKEVRLEITGDNTQVDRDILERLETPLAHLLRNAVDHGCESPEQRRQAGKPAEGLIRIEARHSAGMLLVTVTDDGGGIHLDRLRSAVVQRKLIMPAAADKLSEAELMEYLFLPGFSLKDAVTEISGRGVGLDVVQNMVRSVRGSIRLASQPGRGMRVQLQLPLTLSVLRALLVEIGGEPYAIPLTQISRTLQLPRDQIHRMQGRNLFSFGDQHVVLLAANQLLGLRESTEHASELPVVVVGDRNARYGLVVDRFLGDRELVVQPLDPRLGKVRDIAAAALMEDGSPVLIVDVDDMLQSIEAMLARAGTDGGFTDLQELPPRRIKRVLAVDDSVTVRELQRLLLTSRGYHTDVAVDGLDGWNAVRSGQYDLVVTDVEMPRMDGIELASLIKNDPELKSLPVIIVSHSEREEDRRRGREAGVEHYLPKGGLHDETLLRIITELIGEPET